MTAGRDYFLARSEVDENGCWIWQLFIKPNGYGQYGRNLYAHRGSYETFKGEIPEGLEIDHLCGNKACINPDHLEAVSHGENNKRGWHRRGSSLYCKRGHLMTGDNIRFTRRGYRNCRACRNEKRMEYYYDRRSRGMSSYEASGDKRRTTVDDGGAS